MKWFFGLGLPVRRTRGSPRKRLQVFSALLPKDRHQGQYEVGLIELRSLTVYSNEDLRDRIHSRVGRDHKGVERVLRQHYQAANGGLDSARFFLRQLADLSELGEIIIGQLECVCSRSPHVRDIRDKRAVLRRRGVGDFESF
jgi:hypothetical protein